LGNLQKRPVERKFRPVPARAPRCVVTWAHASAGAGRFAAAPGGLGGASFSAHLHK